MLHKQLLPTINVTFLIFFVVALPLYYPVVGFPGVARAQLCWVEVHEPLCLPPLCVPVALARGGAPTVVK